MTEIKNCVDELLANKGKTKDIICALCGKKIEDTAFILVRGAIVVNDKSLKTPLVFTCPEQAFNYAQGYYAHSVCWIARLKQLGVVLYDMDKVYEDYNKELKEDKHGLGENKSSK